MIRLNAKLILVGLILVNLLFVVAHLTIVSTGLAEAVAPEAVERRFDLGAERNFSTWFSGSQLLFVALLAMVRSAQLGDQGKHSLRRFYLLMAAVFLFFSLDEIASVHEGLTLISREIEVYSPLPGAHGIWIFIYPVALLVVLWLFRAGLVGFLREMPGRTAYLLGAAVFVLGGIGFEIVGYYLDAGGPAETLGRQLIIVLEEGGELLGQSLVVYALLVKIGSFSVSFGAVDKTAAGSSKGPASPGTE